MLKMIYMFIFGNWCRHDWVIIYQHLIQRIESGGGRRFTVSRNSMMLKCTKCGKLIHKTV